MRLGKLSNEALERLILSKFRHIRPEVICSPQIGVDCAAVDLAGGVAVMSMDPITSASGNLGWLTVHVNCNDAAAAGAEPIGILVTLLAPPTATEEEIGAVADQLSEAARLANIDVIGGHTEVTDSVTRMVTCATVLARTLGREPVTPGGMKPGDDLVLSKTAGLEGTAVIASDFRERLGFLTQAQIEEAKGMINMVSVVKEGILGACSGATAMHDVTEGGVYGAAWEMAYASGCGLELNKESIPVHPTTRAICEAFSLEPMRLLSSGCMLISCPQGERMAKELRKSGVQASVIGAAVEGSGVALNDGTRIAPPGTDELYRLFSEF